MLLSYFSNAILDFEFKYRVYTELFKSTNICDDKI